MAPETTDPHVNPADETIRPGPLAVRFLITGAEASGSLALFELTVPATQRLTAPAHSHDHYEETVYGIEGLLTWTVDGTRVDVGPGASPLHPARRHTPVRQQRQPGCEGALCHHTSRDRPAVFSRGGRGGQGGARWATRPGQDGRNHAPTWPHPGAVTMSFTEGTQGGDIELTIERVGGKTAASRLEPLPGRESRARARRTDHGREDPRRHPANPLAADSVKSPDA